MKFYICSHLEKGFARSIFSFLTISLPGIHENNYVFYMSVCTFRSQTLYCGFAGCTRVQKCIE